MQILWFLPDCSADLCSDPWPPFSLLSAGIFQLPTPLSSRWLYSNSLAASHALISVTFTLLPASSVLAAFTDPPLAFWSAASILLLFRWGDPRCWCWPVTDCPASRPPASLSAPLSGPRDSTPPVYRNVTGQSLWNWARMKLFLLNWWFLCVFNDVRRYLIHCHGNYSYLSGRVITTFRLH